LYGIGELGGNSSCFARQATRDVANGHGLLACLSGEPGIGKTTVAEGFLEELANSGETCFVTRGRCSERLAGSEAYLPVLEALDSLLQGPFQGTTIRAMKTLAPAWFAQVASVDTGRAGERQPAQAVTQEQLKRQMGALLRELSRTSPVIVFLDDLHWADTATIDLLAYLAAKFAELRLLVIVTYRPSDLRLTKHAFLPLKLDLQARGVCRDIEVGFLTLQEIESYLAQNAKAAVDVAVREKSRLVQVVRSLHQTRKLIPAGVKHAEALMDQMIVIGLICS
jgi:predicted ATPase